MYRRDAFLEMGGFDERFFGYLEDTDLGLRMQLTGRRCLYVANSVVHHVGSATTGVESEYTVYHTQRNMIWLWVKGMPLPLLLLYLPQHLAVNVLMAAWFSMRGRARVTLAAKRDAIAGIPRVLRERRAVQRSRRVGARELRARMGHGAGAYSMAFTRAVGRVTGRLG